MPFEIIARLINFIFIYGINIILKLTEQKVSVIFMTDLLPSLLCTEKG